MSGLVSVPKTAINRNSNFLSKKHQLLSLLDLSSSPRHLSQIHAQLHLSGLQHDAFLVTQLIRFSSLSPSKNLSYALSLLNHLPAPVTSSWNFIIRGYSSSDTPREAVWVFRRLKREGVVKPNKLTFPFVVKACAEFLGIGEGRQVHCEVVKYGLDFDVYVNNNLVNFYGVCKLVDDACKVFDEMTERSVVSWNAVMTACVESFRFGDVVRWFLKMWDSGFEPDETSMVIVISVCAEVGNLSLGKWLHSRVIERGMELNVRLGTALVDMYAKSGKVGYAGLVFDRMEDRNVWTWSSMILGLAQHGFAEQALELFNEMIKSSSVCPNYVTFLGVLCACSHSGLVKEGFLCFHEMEHIYGIKPTMIHYGAMVDILGRAGQLVEAYDFIKNMPIEPDPIVWRTLLSACSIHDANKVAKKVQKRLLELEPRRIGNLVMVANMYADSGMWEKAATLRRLMRDRGMKKIGGESCVEFDGSTYRFFSGYDSQEVHQRIYELLDGLNLQMKMANASKS